MVACWTVCFIAGGLMGQPIIGAVLALAWWLGTAALNDITGLEVADAEEKRR
jgi:hypothetical protein